MTIFYCFCTNIVAFFTKVLYHLFRRFSCNTAGLKATTYFTFGTLVICAVRAGMGREVPIITANDIHSFYNRYNENNRLLDEKERELLNDSSDLASWVGLLRERSALARKIYLENAKGIRETIEPFLNDHSLLTDETVRAFLEETALIVGKE